MNMWLTDSIFTFVCERSTICSRTWMLKWRSDTSKVGHPVVTSKVVDL